MKYLSFEEKKAKVAKFNIIDDVYFQRTVPVNLAEVEVRIPGMFTFNKKMRGFHHVEYKPDIEPRTLGSYHYEMGWTSSQLWTFRHSSTSRTSTILTSISPQ
jgi:hypothetical protein